MLEQEQFETYRNRIADIITEATSVLSGKKLAELLIFMSVGATTNLKALSIPKTDIDSAKELYQKAASIAMHPIDKDTKTG